MGDFWATVGWSEEEQRCEKIDGVGPRLMPPDCLERLDKDPRIRLVVPQLDALLLQVAAAESQELMQKALEMYGLIEHEMHAILMYSNTMCMH